MIRYSFRDHPVLAIPYIAVSQWNHNAGFFLSIHLSKLAITEHVIHPRVYIHFAVMQLTLQQTKFRVCVDLIWGCMGRVGIEYTSVFLLFILRLWAKSWICYCIQGLAAFFMYSEISFYCKLNRCGINLETFCVLQVQFHNNYWWVLEQLMWLEVSSTFLPQRPDPHLVALPLRAKPPLDLSGHLDPLWPDPLLKCFWKHNCFKSPLMFLSIHVSCDVSYKCLSNRICLWVMNTN